MYEEIQRLINEMNPRAIPYVMLTLYGILIGIFIEWRGLKLILSGDIKINWLIIPSLLVLIIGFIPDYNWFYWFGVGEPWFIEPLRFRESQMAIDIIAGILLIRSLTNKT